MESGTTCIKGKCFTNKQFQQLILFLTDASFILPELQMYINHFS